MAYKIAEEKIAEVREATDIVELISGYLTLKKRGKNYFGLCPFHTENTPSFSVDPTRQMYHCFGCHKGGNAITFLMDYEKMSFLEAIEFLAEKAGITLPKTQVSDHLAREKESLYFANKFAAEFFYHNLINPVGQKALSYLQQRGYAQSIIRSFGLGYALPEWDGLIKFARSKSVNLEILHNAGLLIKKEGGGFYDRFRGRVMFPIINLTKKVVGFGGRILTEQENSPKYINSPETPIYQKSQILFGLYRTREHIREKDQAIFVEGYTDQLSLFKYGIKNTVATAGTALTISQAQLIKRYTENIILLYDSDAAGSAAAMRGADIFLNAGLEVKIAVLPKGEDPDSYIREQGTEKFYQILSAASSLITFKIETLSAKYNMAQTSDRAKVIQLVLESVAKVKDRIKRSLILKEVAEYFKLEERILLQQLQTIKEIPSDDLKKSTINEKSKPIKKTKYDEAEADLVRIVMEESNFIGTVMEHVTADEIRNNTLRKIIQIIFNNYQKNEKTSEQEIMNALSDPKMIEQFSELLFRKYGEEFDLRKLLNDCIISIKQRPLEEKLKSLTEEISQLEKRGNNVRELMKQHQELNREIVHLKSKNFVTSEKKT